MALDKPDFVAKKVDHHFNFTKAIGKIVVQEKMRREWWLTCSSIQKNLKFLMKMLKLVLKSILMTRKYQKMVCHV